MRQLSNRECDAVFGGVTTGLGNYAVDSKADSSPTLSSQINQLSSQGWRIQYGAGRSRTIYDQKIISISSDYVSNVDATLSQLAHEVGHAFHPSAQPNQGIQWVNNQLFGEGWAQVNAIHVSQEMQQHGTSIGAIPGTPADIQRIMDAYNIPGNTAEQQAYWVGQAMAFAQLDNGQTYWDFYADAWNAANPNNKVKMSNGSGGSTGGSTTAGGHGTFDDTWSPIGGQGNPPSGGTVTVDPPKRLN